MSIFAAIFLAIVLTVVLGDPGEGLVVFAIILALVFLISGVFAS